MPGERGPPGAQGLKGIQGDSGEVGVTYIRWGRRNCPNSGATWSMKVTPKLYIPFLQSSLVRGGGEVKPHYCHRM